MWKCSAYRHLASPVASFSFVKPSPLEKIENNEYDPHLRRPLTDVHKRIRVLVGSSEIGKYFETSPDNEWTNSQRGTAYTKSRICWLQTQCVKKTVIYRGKININNKRQSICRVPCLKFVLYKCNVMCRKQASEIRRATRWYRNLITRSFIKAERRFRVFHILFVRHYLHEVRLSIHVVQHTYFNSC